MGVLIVTQDYPPDRGGIQTYCRELARHLSAQGEQVRVLCPTVRRSARGAVVDGAEGDAAGGGAVAVDRLWVPSSFLFAPLLATMRRYLRAHPDLHTIVYAQWQSALWQLAAPEEARRYRRLCLVHGRELLYTVLGPLTRPLSARVLASMDEVYPVSRRVQAMLSRLDLPPRVRLRVVPPGVDPGRFVPLDARPPRQRLGLDNARVILSISRLAGRKNLDGLIRAFARVKERVPSAVLVIGGDGPARPQLEAQARKTGLIGAIRFLGAIPDDELVAHYNLADLFVLPSRDHPRDVEGFGITLLEAGACERPVVAGRAGGMADAVVDGETGLLVDPDDDNALADGIIALLSDPARARRLGEAARARIVRQLSWAHCAQHIREGFAPAANAPAPPTSAPSPHQTPPDARAPEAVSPSATGPGAAPLPALVTSTDLGPFAHRSPSPRGSGEREG